jgi:alkylation response protein AidB-like acyl-CoA dehydrogenase
MPDLVSAVRRFAQDLPSALERDRARELPPEVLCEARSMGLYGLGIPEEHGGSGLALADVAALVAEVARVDRSLATSIGLHNGLGSRALVEAADPALGARYLPALATGERIASFGATEPGAGSDLSAIRATALSDGETLSLSGEKAYVTNAGIAGLYTVLARVPEPGGGLGSALVVVPREAPGLSLGPEEHKLGLRASSTRSVFFDRAHIPVDHVIGGPGRGIADAHRALEYGRTLMSAGCLGTARAALERSIEHTGHRRQFRRALRSFGAVRAHLARMAVAVVAIEALLQQVGNDEARGVPIDSSSAALKVLASELACDACDRAIQVHGALGYVEDAGIALLFRDARVTRIFEGANDVLLVRLGTALLSGRGLASRARHLQGGDFGMNCDRLQDASRKTRDMHGVGAVAHQRLITSLARADVWLCAADACLARQDALGRESARVLARAASEALDQADLAEQDERTDDALLELVGLRGEALVRPPTNRFGRTHTGEA